MQLIVVLALAAVIGPFASWGLASLKAQWELADERASHKRELADEKARGIAACNERVAEIGRRLEAANAENQRLAEEAERAVGPTPIEAAELQDLCNKSASCRDRKGTK